MKKVIFLLTILCFSITLSGQNTEHYSRAKVLLSGKTIHDLARLGIETDHGQLQPGKCFTTDLSEQEIEVVRQAGFQVEILIADVVQYYVDQNLKGSSAGDRTGGCDGNVGSALNYPTPVNYTYGSMGGYPTLDEIYAILADMAVKYPNLITIKAKLSETQTTHDGQYLYYVRLSDNPGVSEGEPQVLYTGLHHCREPNGMTGMLYYMWYLLENYETDARVRYIVDNVDLYFVPCVNPDGYLYNEATNPQGGGLWRKNRRENADGSYGVDLNRNYGYFWGNDDIGSSPDPSSPTYRGPSLFSEPETQIVRDFVLANDFKVCLNYHTFSNLLIYPWAYNDVLADPTFEKLASIYSKENHYTIGTPSQTVGYRVNGDSNDWMYSAKSVYAFVPEVGPPFLGFWPPMSEIDKLNKETMWMNLCASLTVLKFGVVEDISPVTVQGQSATIDYKLTRFGFEDGNFTVSLEGLSPYITSISPAQQYNLNQFEEAVSAFSVGVSPNTPIGYELKFLLKLDNGNYVSVDTLRKIYSGTEVLAFKEDGNAINEWTVVTSGTPSGWGPTFQDYYTAISSITDSPNGSYASNSTNTIVLSNGVMLPATGVKATLTYWAKYSIEAGWDYVQVLAGTQVTSMTAQCATHTHAGDLGTQGTDAPLYDGVLDEWVQECVDLSDFIGGPVQVGFTMVADQEIEYDGFYFDDLKITYLDSTTNQIVEIPIKGFELSSIQPNPSDGAAVVKWTLAPGQTPPMAIELVNALGMVVYRQNLTSADFLITLPTQHLAAGLYSVKLIGENQVDSRKFTVQH